MPVPFAASPELRVTLEMAFERSRADQARARLQASAHAARLEAEEANLAKVPGVHP